MHIVRAVLGILAGVALAFLLVAFAEEAGHKIYPVPTDIDWSDNAQVQRFTDSLPVGALLLLLASWVGATFIGAAIGSSIARPRAILISTIVGGLMLAATIFNFLLTPHPWWLVISTIAGIAAATWLAVKLTWKPLASTSSA
jgi:hypothetical protein